MHYRKLTSVRMGGGRFLCIQIQAQWAQAALQGIICSPVQTLLIRVSRSPFCLTISLCYLREFEAEYSKITR